MQLSGASEGGKRGRAQNYKDRTWTTEEQGREGNQEQAIAVNRHKSTTTRTGRVVKESRRKKPRDGEREEEGNGGMGDRRADEEAPRSLGRTR